MSFTYTDIPNISKKRFLFKSNSTLHKKAGSEINSASEFFEDKNSIWFSVANYTDPHLSESDISSSTFIVKLDSKYVDEYTSIMQDDLGITFKQISSEPVLLLSTDVNTLTDFQRYQLAAYPDIRENSLEDFTDPEVSYNQNQQDIDFASTYGSGMSHRVFKNIHRKLKQIQDEENPIEEIKTYLTGRKTDERAEQILEILTGKTTESILYELGSLKPKNAFGQLVDKLYDETIQEISIPIDYENVLTDVEYVKVELYS